VQEHDSKANGNVYIKLLLLRGGVFIVLLLLWEAAASLKLVNINVLPPPSNLLEESYLLIKSGLLFSNLLGSLYRVTLGFSIAVCLGVLAGTLLGYFSTIGRVVAPILDIFRPIPPIAWIPLAILWFGLGNSSSIFIIALGAFFPIFVNTFAGVTSVSHYYLDTGRCFGASQSLIIYDIILPAALPQVLTGVRIGIGTAWTSVIASEMVGTRDGLGYAIQLSRVMLDTEAVIVNMILIGIIGWLMNALILNLEKRVAYWHLQRNV